MNPPELRVIFFVNSADFLPEFSRTFGALGFKMHKKIVAQIRKTFFSTATKRVKSTKMSTSEEDLQRQLIMHDNHFMDLENYTLTKVDDNIRDQALSMQKDRGAVNIAFIDTISHTRYTVHYGKGTIR